MIQLQKLYIDESETLSLQAILRVAPSIKYEIDKEHPLDSTKRIRYGKYYQDEIDLSALVSQTEYESLVEFLKSAEPANTDSGEGLYVVYDTNKCYPITEIKGLPENKNMEGLVRFKTTFSVVSTYIIRKMPSFTEYGDGEYSSGSYGF